MACFRSKIGTDNTVIAGYGDFWFEGPFEATDSDFAQGIFDFGRQIFLTPIGLAWFSNGWSNNDGSRRFPGRGFLHQPIRPLDGAHRAALDRKLATSQFVVNGPTNPALPLQNAGSTPLEGTLLTALDYFQGEGGSWRDAAEGYVPACYPLPQSCGRNFVVLLTDGLPSTRPDGTIIQDMAGGLRQTAEAARRLRQEANVETFVIGFALPFGTNPEQLNEVAAAGGTERAFAANDPATLDTALQAIFADIAARSSSVAAVAANSTNVSSSTRIYQARFDPRDWSGTLSAHSITGTAVAEQAQWEARIPATRRILSYRPDTRQGVAFAWDELNPEQQRQIGAPDVLAYLRGSQAQEAPRGPLRRRTSLLGDIVNSAPVYVGAPEMPYTEASYREFRKARADRRKMVYVGANDGMLHAFDADTGQELFAYVPSTVIPHLRQLSDPKLPPPLLRGRLAHGVRCLHRRPVAHHPRGGSGRRRPGRVRAGHHRSRCDHRSRRQGRRAVGVRRPRPARTGQQPTGRFSIWTWASASRSLPSPGPGQAGWPCSATATTMWKRTARPAPAAMPCCTPSTWRPARCTGNGTLAEACKTALADGPMA